MMMFKSQRVITPEGERAASVIVGDGQIVAIEAYDFHADDIPVVDYQQRVLMPGIVDSHVHINEPGRTDWEGFDTATHAAAAGGITTVVDMPLNCIPVTITAQALQEKLAVLDDKLWIDAGFWGGATADNLGELPDLLDAGVLGVKSFTIHSGIDEFQFVNETQLTDAMRELAKRGMPHLVHAELDHAHSEPMSIASSYQSFLKTRPPAWENDAIAMVIRVMKTLIAEGLQPHAHIVHLSSAEALPMIQQARADGLNLTVETCPHYLVLEAETIPDGQATYKCCPPIREKSNQDLLWQALLDGTIDCVVSDHSPCTPQLKNIDSGDLEKAWGGISGLQFGLPLLWTHAQDKGMSLTQLIELMSARPARLTGLTNKGSIAIGQQADFCVFDPDGQFTVTPEIIHHRHKISPYVGKTLQGVVVATLLAGQTIYQQGEFVGSARGRALLKEAVQ
ncbi:allantoinase AllB [Reinekea sp. G2M2-21]|uniref:allantoinase AllB n=1 Tax=Reinekea sp. G2M2-21 TaxID=2788942 RepID=UPI0018AA886A|nr:allantoinase AllB [Reinekea sp. G2M2-21]